ncbi:uncharacterized protein LOC142612497 [Castanea sativa]|uniref:uncharacterized protein LOC142612497 n=1 Tax=Castanea sativa TaxID=21020 RepID=UPI003F6546EC
MAEHFKHEEIDLSETKAMSPTPVLIAAMNGITEVVEKILKNYPIAMHEMHENKNIILLTVEHKQPDVYELLLSLKQKGIINDSVFFEVDRTGNSALHLAATEAKFNWPVPGAASQMQWEIKWYEFVKNSMQRRIPLLNKNGQTSEEIFTESHKGLVKEGSKWLTDVSNAGMVVAGIFVAVTLTMSTTVLDSAKEGNKRGKPSNLFAGSSFFSFCTSFLAVVMFLSIAASSFLVCADLPSAYNILFSHPVSAILSFGVGNLQEGAKT